MAGNQKSSWDTFMDMAHRAAQAAAHPIDTAESAGRAIGRGASSGIGEALSWLPALEGARQTILPSTAHAVKDMAMGAVNTVAHPVNTARAIGELGSGAVSKIGRYASGQGSRPTTQGEARREAVLDAAWDGIANKYSVVDPHTGERTFDENTFKHTLATDPASIMMDAATFTPMAGGAITKLGKVAEAAGDIGKIGTAAQAVGRTLTRAGDIANPLAIPAFAAKKAAPLAKTVIGAVANAPLRYVETVSGVPRAVMGSARKAGAAGAEKVMGSQTAGDIFKQFASGEDGAGKIQETAHRALNAIRQDASDAYMSGKADLAKTPVNYNSILDTIDKAQDELHRGSVYGFPEAKDAVAKARAMVEDIATHPDDAARNIVNTDALKRQIWDLRDATSNNVAKQYLGNVYNGIKGAMSDVDPAYADLMESYQSGLQNVQDLVKTLGVSQKTADTAALAKQLRAVRTPSGADLFSQLAEKEPALPYMIAGHSARQVMPNSIGKLADVAATMAAIHTPDPRMILGAATQAAASSPAAVLHGAYGVGKVTGGIGRAAEKVGEYVPEAVKTGAGMAASAAGELAPTPLTGAAMAGQFQHEEENKPPVPEDIGVSPKMFTGEEVAPARDEDQSAPHEPDQMSAEDFFKVEDAGNDSALDNEKHPAENRATGGRTAYKSGGKVDDDIDAMVCKLIARARHAKKASNKSTEPLLNQHDDIIAKALSVAQKAI